MTFILLFCWLLPLALLAYLNRHPLASLAWRVVARIVSQPRIADWLIQRAMKTPYTHLPGYMNRYWLFNAYRKQDGQEITPIPWLPSIRIHHILRKDADRDMHDHPWDARSIILKGTYVERRLSERDFEMLEAVGGYTPKGESIARLEGDTATLKFGEYHTITYVPKGGVWTLFITYGYKGTWGFLVGGKKVPWREYMAMHPDKPWASEEETP